MGITPPKVFTRCDKNICLAGLLPSISLEASEETVRKEICEVFHSCCSPNLSAIQPGDFEFISMSGKQASVPQCKNGFKWDGRAVKELAGSGSVYVRWIKDSVYPQSDDDLPPWPCTISSNSQGTDAAVVDHEERNEDLRSSGLSSDVNGNNADSIINLDSDEELSISSSSATGSRSASNITESTFLTRPSGFNNECNLTNILETTSTATLYLGDTVASTTSITGSTADVTIASTAHAISTTASVTAHSSNTASSSITTLGFPSSSEDDLSKLQDTFSNNYVQRSIAIYLWIVFMFAPCH